MKSKHLDEIEMSYSYHVRRALRFSFYCALCSVKTFIHAFIPDLFSNTSGEMDAYLENFIFDEEED